MAKQTRTKEIPLGSSLNLDIQTPAYKRMKKHEPMIAALMGGTAAVRALGETFLPRNTAESVKNYENRLSTAFLTPFFSTNVKKMAGKVFAKAPTLSEDMDEKIRLYCDDIDMQGNNLHCFASDALAEVIAYGMGWILVDFPIVSPEQTRTVAEEKLSGARPYWNYLHFSQVPYVKRNSVSKQIEEAIVIEFVEVVNGSSVDVEKRFRVLRPGSWELWRESAESKKSNKTAYELIDSGITTIDFVALVPLFAGRIGSGFEAVPPLLDMAYLNIAHYQGRSNQQNALTVAQFPILAASGWRPEEPTTNAAGVPNNNDPIAIGPRKLLHADDPQAKFYFVEHTGAAIEAGRNYLSDIKDEITIQGLQLLMPRADTAAKTATESSNQQDDTLCELERIAKSYQDALNQALMFTAKWVRSDKPGSIALNGRFDLPRGASDQNTLLSMRQNGDLSRGTLYAEMQRRGVLSDSFNPDDEKEILLNEAPDMGIEE